MNSNYKPMKSLVRATFAAGDTAEPRFEKVDREAKVLHGVQITLSRAKRSDTTSGSIVSSAKMSWTRAISAGKPVSRCASDTRRCVPTPSELI